MLKRPANLGLTEQPRQTIVSVIPLAACEIRLYLTVISDTVVLGLLEPVSFRAWNAMAMPGCVNPAQVFSNMFPSMRTRWAFFNSNRFFTMKGQRPGSLNFAHFVESPFAAPTKPG